MGKSMPIVTVAKAAAKIAAAPAVAVGRAVRRSAGISGDAGRLVARAYKPMDPGTTIAIAKRASKGK